MGCQAQLEVFGDPKGSTSTSHLVEGGDLLGLARPDQYSENRHIDLQEHVENPDSRACGQKT